MDGLQVKVDSKDLSTFYQAAKASPGGLQVELRRGVKAAAEPIKRDVQNAAGFSSRIPAAVKTKVSFRASGASVQVVVDPKAAPHAAPINNKGRGGTFRHPVYADASKPRDEWGWADQKAVPFFAAGTRQGAPAAEAAMLRMMDDYARKLGFR